jgi:peptidoglycan/LPS O-acetylase OafA/YrhL
VVALALPVYAVALVNGASVDTARTILTTLASFLGIGALTLIPIAAQDRGRIRMPAWARVAALVGSLVGAYLVVLSTDAGRSFFQLVQLPWQIVGTLLLIAAAWTTAVIAIHRTRIVQRGIDVLIDARTWLSIRPSAVAVLGRD